VSFKSADDFSCFESLAVASHPLQPGFLIPFWTPQGAAKKKQSISSDYAVSVLLSQRK